MEENHQLALGRTDKQRVLNGLKQLLEVREVMLCWRAGHQNVPIGATSCGGEGELRSFPFHIELKNATVMKASAVQPEDVYPISPCLLKRQGLMCRSPPLKNLKICFAWVYFVLKF